MQTWTVAILTSLIGSGAIFGFIQFLMQRKDNSLESKLTKRFDKIDSKVDEFKTDLKMLDRKIDDNKALQARARILRFSSEVQSGIKFSKEAWDQTFEDISMYNAHCDKYKDADPPFKNFKAESAIKNIARIHAENLELERRGENVFL